MVDEERARFLRAKGAVTAEGHLGEVVVRAHAADDDVGILGRLGGADAGDAAILLDPGLRLAHGTVIDGQFMACSREMARNRRAHDPKPDKRNFCHWAGIVPVS
jgi:hypothetical protein